MKEYISSNIYLFIFWHNVSIYSYTSIAGDVNLHVHSIGTMILVLVVVKWDIFTWQIKSIVIMDGREHGKMNNLKVSVEFNWNPFCVHT